jgi:hypothetical protein
VGFHHGGGDEPGDRGVVREDADDFGAALPLGVEAFDTLTTASTITTSTYTTPRDTIASGEAGRLDE